MLKDYKNMQKRQLGYQKKIGGNQAHKENSLISFIYTAINSNLSTRNICNGGLEPKA